MAVGRKSWIFAGSDSGGHRDAAAYTLIETCKFNDVDPQAWIADMLARLPDHPASRIAELLPWNLESRALRHCGLIIHTVVPQSSCDTDRTDTTRPLSDEVNYR